jgi:hypothetical protein
VPPLSKQQQQREFCFVFCFKNCNSQHKGQRTGEQTPVPPASSQTDVGTNGQLQSYGALYEFSGSITAKSGSE